MRSGIGSLSALVPLALSACALQRVPLHGRPWQRLESPHFALYTDLAPAAAEQQACDLERLLAALHDTGWDATGPLPSRVNVVVTADRTTFESLGGVERGGYHMPSELFEPWIVMPAPAHGEGNETLAHELTHYIAFQAMPYQPPWFAEGLATYFQTAHFTDRDTFELGSAPRGLYAWIAHDHAFSPSQLLRGVDDPLSTRFYASAWLFAHYLMNERPEDFARFQELLARGHAPGAAFSVAFREEPEALDAAVEAYARGRSYAMYTFRVRPPVCRTKAQVLREADIYALSALLLSTCPGCSAKSEAPREVAEALRRSPEHALANMFQLRYEPRAQAFERAQRLLRVHPDDWRVWLSFGMLALVQPGYEALARDPSRDPGARAMKLAPDQPFAVLLAACSSLARGERAEAERLGALAARMQPANAKLLGGYALLLAALARCDQVEEVVTRALALAEGALGDEESKELRKMADACRATATPTRN
jgi:hypothetical protein